VRDDNPDDEEPTLYLLEATSTCGTTVRTGPVDIGQGIIIIDQHLVPNGWAPKLQPLLPLDRALRVFTVGERPEPVEAADRFVALRRAIITDPANDGADCPRAAALLAHLQAHRPLQLWHGEEDCLLGECDHDRKDGYCPGLEPTDRICVACSAVYDSGSEYGPEWLAAGRVKWPCPRIQTATGHYQVPLGEVSNAT
jgi:hypothetical protein